MNRFAALALVFAAPLVAGELDDLYQSGRWFEFRDAILQAKTPPAPFYRAQLAYAFHDWDQAEKGFQAALKSDPAHWADTLAGLRWIYQLTGRRNAIPALLASVERIQRDMVKSGALSPEEAKQLEPVRDVLSAESQFPNQIVAARGFSRLFYFETAHQIRIPLAIRGQPANYVIDTGSQECIMAVSEARRLGLTVHPTPSKLAVPGADFKEQVKTPAGVALADDLVIGNFHLRNVLFTVMPDEDTPGGVIGLPVLLALETMRWNSDGTLEFGFPAQPRDLAAANLAFANPLLVTKAQIAGFAVPLVLGLDTGSDMGFLLPRFSQDFPGLMGPIPVGDLDLPDGAIAIHPLSIRVGGLQAALNPALVMPAAFRGADGANAWLGMTILDQARSVTVDLAAMKLTLDGIDGAAAIVPTAKECLLPPDFYCAPGFSCVAKNYGGLCVVDRVPETAPLGNSFASERDADQNCVLTALAHCEKGGACRAVFDSDQSCHIEAASVEAPPRVTLPPASREARDIMQHSLRYESLDFTPVRDYTWIDEDAETTFSSDGAAKGTTLQAHEVMNLYGETFQRLISKDGKDLSPEKARAEQAKFDKAVEKQKQQRAQETPQAKAKREQNERKREADDLSCDEEFLKLFTFRLESSETLKGRPAWIVEGTPSPSAVPHCNALKPFSKIHFRAWVDQAEYRWAKFEIDNIGPVSWGKILIRVPAGGLHFTYESERHEDGAWLPALQRLKVNARLLVAAPIRIESVDTYTKYRKFRADSRLVTSDDAK